MAIGWINGPWRCCTFHWKATNRSAPQHDHRRQWLYSCGVLPLIVLACLWLACLGVLLKPSFPPTPPSSFDRLPPPGLVVVNCGAVESTQHFDQNKLWNFSRSGLPHCTEKRVVLECEKWWMMDWRVYHKKNTWRRLDWWGDVFHALIFQVFWVLSFSENRHWLLSPRISTCLESVSLGTGTDGCIEGFELVRVVAQVYKALGKHQIDPNQCVDVAWLLQLGLDWCVFLCTLKCSCGSWVQSVEWGVLGKPLIEFINRMQDHCII